ncbi:MAG: peptidylprolyl isomerase [Patescibacteria group bacterium]
MSQKSSKLQSFGGAFVLALVIFGLYFYMGNSEKDKIKDLPEVNIKDASDKDAKKGSIAVFETNKGVIKIELFTDKMPITTENFKKLINQSFYNGVRFHRVIDNFMVQAGDPKSKDLSLKSEWGTGGPGYTIQDEFVAGLSNVKGTIAMANIGQPNSGGSQFFINTVDNIYLDFDKPPLTSQHPVFGKIIEGMDIVLGIKAGDIINIAYIE